MKKFISIFIIISTITTSLLTTPLSTYALESNNNDSDTIITLNEDVYFSDLKNEDLNNADMIVFDREAYNESSVDDLKEVLDNGTDIIISEDSSSVYNDFEADVEFDELDTTGLAGYYISSNGNDYNISPIEYALMPDDTEENEFTEEDNDYLSEIVANDPIDVELVMSDVEKLEGIDKLNQLDNDTVAQLQTATILGNSFVENDKFVYFYKKGAVNGTGMTYKYSGASSLSGYSKLGSLSLLIYGIKIKTSGNTTYDTIYSTCTASALNNKWVLEFDVNLGVTANSTNKIIDYTSPTNTESSVTGSISTGINSSGEISANAEESYTYNPNKLASIKPVCGEKYYKKWKCEAYSNATYANRSWTVKPAIVLKKTNGKNNSVNVSVYVNHFKLYGGLRTYTFNNKANCRITFKNHKAV